MTSLRNASFFAGATALCTALIVSAPVAAAQWNCHDQAWQECSFDPATGMPIMVTAECYSEAYERCVANGGDPGWGERARLD